VGLTPSPTQSGTLLLGWVEGIDAAMATADSRYETVENPDGLSPKEVLDAPASVQREAVLLWFVRHYDSLEDTSLTSQAGNYLSDNMPPHTAEGHLIDEFSQWLPWPRIQEVIDALRAPKPPRWARRHITNKDGLAPLQEPASTIRRMPSKKRYYSFEDYDGLTPSQLKRASKADQIRYMQHWFWTFYEDPSAGMPHISKEGGFQYIWGGPYDAMEELFHEFDGTVSESRIREAAESVQSDGTYDWAPSPEHPNRRADREEFQAGDELSEALAAGASEETPEEALESVTEMLKSGSRPYYGAADEIAQRQDILARLAVAEAEIAKLKRKRRRKRPAARNHNNPPELLADEEGDRLDDAEKAVVEIKGELAKEKPDAPKVASATARLFAFVKFGGKKIGEKMAEKVGEKIMDSSIVQSGLALLKEHVFKAAQKIVEWLTNITLPF